MHPELSLLKTFNAHGTHTHFFNGYDILMLNLLEIHNIQSKFRVCVSFHFLSLSHILGETFLFIGLHFTSKNFKLWRSGKK